MLRNWFSGPEDTDLSFTRMTRNILTFAIMEAAARRAALSLENVRLLQDAQKMAAKERTIGENSAKIGGSSNLKAYSKLPSKNWVTLCQKRTSPFIKRSQETE